MKELFDKVGLSVNHLQALNDFFSNESIYLNEESEKKDFEIYKSNLDSLISSFKQIDLFEQLYNQKDRQMILADLFEYILFGRGFYSIGTKRANTESKQEFIKGILHLVNLLMCYETLTINTERRNKFLDFLKTVIPNLEDEDGFTELRNYSESVGIPDSEETTQVGKYFDRLLPKTAGGLWHELLVYIFILRHDIGYILPLLLHQKIYSGKDHLVPPDFLLITKDKRIYGIEVGMKKEIQSGSFSLKTAIPTATIDTINSRNSDRCPICKKWINFCPYVIEKFSDFEQDISNVEVKCLEKCDKFSKEDIANGLCKYSKYSRNKADTLSHTHHEYSDGKHYHYQCILSSVEPEQKQSIIGANDKIAIKAHIPYYSGLEELFKTNL